MANDIARTFREMVESILAATNINNYEIRLALHTPDKKVDITVPYVGNVNIVQEFEAHMTEYIHISLDLPYSQYTLVQRNEKDLYCTFVVRTIDTTNASTGSVVFSKRMKAVLQQRHDPYKVENAVALVSNNQQQETVTQHIAFRTIQLQLYDPVRLKPSE